MSNNKTCTKCGEEKPATLEYFHKKGDGIFGHCKVCRLKRAKAYYLANREAVIEKSIAYNEANKEAIVERKKARYEANREAAIEKAKAYYRTPKGKFVGIKARAKERGINFSLLFELYQTQLWGKPCHYCGCEIEVTGLDRKDNSKGYSRDNVVPCCHDCNRKKKGKTYDQFVLNQSTSEWVIINKERRKNE